MDDEENKPETNKKLNKKTKKAIKEIISTIMPSLIAILAVLIVASCVYSIVTQVVDSIKNIGQSIMNFFFGENNGIEITDEQLDSLIESVEALGVDFDDLGLLGDVDYSSEDVQEEMQKEKRKYMKMFLEAQIVTQELNKRWKRLTRTSIFISHEFRWI